MDPSLRSFMVECRGQVQAKLFLWGRTMDFLSSKIIDLKVHIHRNMSLMFLLEKQV